jgi:hypothetical protein
LDDRGLLLELHLFPEKARILRLDAEAMEASEIDRRRAANLKLGAAGLFDAVLKLRRESPAFAGRVREIKGGVRHGGCRIVLIAEGTFNVTSGSLEWAENPKWIPVFEQLVIFRDGGLRPQCQK